MKIGNYDVHVNSSAGLFANPSELEEVFEKHLASDHENADFWYTLLGPEYARNTAYLITLPKGLLSSPRPLHYIVGLEEWEALYDSYCRI